MSSGDAPLDGYWPLLEGPAGQACHTMASAATQYPLNIGETFVVGFDLRFQNRTAAALDTTAAHITTQTVEVYDRDATVPGAILLYSGPISGLSAAVPAMTVFLLANDANFVIWRFGGIPSIAGGSYYVTNWHVCIPLAGTITPPVTAPQDSGTITALQWEQTAGPGDAANLAALFSTQLGWRAGVTLPELVWSDYPTLITGLETRFSLGNDPVALTVTQQRIVTAFPFTTSAGTAEFFTFDDGPGFDSGKFAA